MATTGILRRLGLLRELLSNPSHSTSRPSPPLDPLNFEIERKFEGRCLACGSLGHLAKIAEFFMKEGSLNIKEGDLQD
jgi:hypothetical protein